MFFSQAISLSIEALEESEEKLREGACVALTVLQVRMFVDYAGGSPL